MLPNKFSNKLLNLRPSVKGLGHKLPNLLLNLCQSPFTLAACVATSLRAPAASSIFSTYNDVTKAVHCVVESHGYSLQPSSGSEQMTSLGIPFSDWLNENISQLVAELVSSVNGSIEKHRHIVGHVCNLCTRMCMHILGHKFSNFLLNLLSNMWLV